MAITLYVLDVGANYDTTKTVEEQISKMPTPILLKIAKDSLVPPDKRPTSGEILIHYFNYYSPDKDRLAYSATVLYKEYTTGKRVVQLNTNEALALQQLRTLKRIRLVKNDFYVVIRDTYISVEGETTNTTLLNAFYIFYRLLDNKFIIDTSP